MDTPIGEMRDPMAILTPTDVADQSGGQETVYAESASVFCSIRPLTTREATVFAQVNAEISHVMFGHYEELKDVAANDRIRWLEMGIDFDVAGLPMNSPSRNFTRLSLIQREHV